jgi:hypothetical protein
MLNLRERFSLFLIMELKGEQAHRQYHKSYRRDNHPMSLHLFDL